MGATTVELGPVQAPTLPPSLGATMSRREFVVGLRLEFKFEFQSPVIFVKSPQNHSSKVC